MMDGVPILRPTTLDFSSLEPKGSTSIPNAYIDSRLLISHVGEQMMTKAKMLQNQFRNMVIMAYSLCFHLQDLGFFFNGQGGNQ